MSIRLPTKSKEDYMADTHSGIPTDYDVISSQDFIKWLLEADPCLSERMRNLEDVLNQPADLREGYILLRCARMNDECKAYVHVFFTPGTLTNITMSTDALLEYVARLRGWLPLYPANLMHSIIPPKLWTTR